MSNGLYRFFITHGDGLLRADPPVTEWRVLGRVVLVSRGGRSFEPGRQASAAVKLISFILRRIRWTAGLLVRLHAMYQYLGRQSWWNKPAPA